MEGFDKQLRKILEGYANFLRGNELAIPKHQPYLVHWVRSFLLFARDHGGYTFKQTLDLFLAEVGGRVSTKPWQLQQAVDAIRIYRYQYRGAGSKCDRHREGVVFADGVAMLERLREVICLRHYAKSTEKTYLNWSRRFLAYRRGTGAEGEPSAADAKAILTHLAMVENVSASTQNQAFSALLLLFREVLRTDLEEMAQACFPFLGAPELREPCLSRPRQTMPLSRSPTGSYMSAQRASLGQNRIALASSTL